MLTPDAHPELDRTRGLRAHLSLVWRCSPIRVLLALGVLLRFALILAPSVPHWGGDAFSYVEPARNLLHAGRFALGTCPGPTCDPLLWRVPVYSAFIALFQELPRLPLGALYVEQIALDSMSVVLAGVIGWWIGGRRLGILSAAFFALNPFIAVFAAEVMSESLTDLLVLLLTYAMLRLAESRLSMRALPLVGLGVLMGVLALTRQVFAVLPGFALVFLLSRPLMKWLRVVLLVATGFWPVVLPWLAREYVVAVEKGARGNDLIVAPPYAGIVRPGLAAWERTFEEPFVWETFAGPPVVARYLLPGEKERTAALIARLNANNLLNTPDIDAEFAELARERSGTHPIRTRIWSPATRFVKLFAAPRVAGLGVHAGRLTTVPGKLVLLLAMAFNALTSIPGFVYGLRHIRDMHCRVLLLIPVFSILAYLPITFGGQSRYMVPALPSLAILTGAWALVILDRLRERASNAAPVATEPENRALG